MIYRGTWFLNEEINETFLIPKVKWTYMCLSEQMSLKYFYRILYNLRSKEIKKKKKKRKSKRLISKRKIEMGLFP